MKLTKQDRWIVLLLPFLCILFFYGWYGYRPLARTSEALSAKLEGYGSDADDLAWQISKARRDLKEVEAEREKVLAELADGKKRDAGKATPDPATLSPDRRLQMVSRNLERAGVELLSAKRTTDRQREDLGDFLDTETMDRWTFRLRGTYPRILAFLRANGEDGWGVPAEAEMKPPAEPGEASEWTFTIFL